MPLLDKVCNFRLYKKYPINNRTHHIFTFKIALLTKFFQSFRISCVEV